MLQRELESVAGIRAASHPVVICRKPKLSVQNREQVKVTVRYHCAPASLLSFWFLLSCSCVLPRC